MKTVGMLQVLGIVMSIASVSSAYAQSQSNTPTATMDSAASAKASQRSARKADRKLGSDVRRALSKTKEITATNIFVRARDGVVTLTGSVPDNMQIERATQVANGVAGVTSVINKLSLQVQNY